MLIVDQTRAEHLQVGMTEIYHRQAVKPINRTNLKVWDAEFMVG